MSKSAPKGPQAPASTSPFPGVIAIAVALVVVGLIVGLLISRAGSQPAASPTAAPAAEAPAAPAADAQAFPTAAAYSYEAAPPMTIDPARDYTATIYTPRGEIVVELLPEIAPQTVNNFVFLARENFYNGLTWHRVLQGFMAQGGDPAGDGTGGPGYSIPAEFSSEVLFDSPGLVAMARSNDPDSAGSQFFITTAATPWLNDETGTRTNYTIFGRVISGQDVVNGIPLRDPQNPADLATPGETILGITIDEG